MSEQGQRWLEGLAGRAKGDDPELREAAAVRDYLQRRSASEDASAADPQAEARMLAHLRARGAFDPRPPVPARSIRPGAWQRLLDRVGAPLGPRFALGLGGAVLSGLAAVLVLHDPRAGSPRPPPAAAARLAEQAVPEGQGELQRRAQSAPLPAPATAPASGSAPARAAARAPTSAPGRPAFQAPASVPAPAAPAERVASARPPAQAAAAPASPSLAAAPAPVTALAAPVATPAPVTAMSAPVAAPAPVAAMALSRAVTANSKAAFAASAAGAVGGTDARVADRAMDASPRGAAGQTEGITLDRLFDDGTVVLNDGGRKWLDDWLARHPQSAGPGTGRLSVGVLVPPGAVPAVARRAQQCLEAVVAWLAQQRPELTVQAMGADDARASRGPVFGETAPAGIPDDGEPRLLLTP